MARLKKSEAVGAMTIGGDMAAILEAAAWLVALLVLAAPFAYASDDGPVLSKSEG